ncbi:MAG: hypothetical protein WC656_01510 [Sulfurimonas sp.]|jgi:hypothetical protein
MLKINRNLLIKIMFRLTIFLLVTNGLIVFGLGIDNDLLFYILSGITAGTFVVFKMAENNNIKNIGFWHLIGTCDYKILK